MKLRRLAGCVGADQKKSYGVLSLDSLFSSGSGEKTSAKLGLSAILLLLLVLIWEMNCLVVQWSVHTK